MDLPHCCIGENNSEHSLRQLVDQLGAQSHLYACPIYKCPIFALTARKRMQALHSSSLLGFGVADRQEAARLRIVALFNVDRSWNT